MVVKKGFGSLNTLDCVDPRSHCDVLRQVQDGLMLGEVQQSGTSKWKERENDDAL